MLFAMRTFSLTTLITVAALLPNVSDGFMLPQAQPLARSSRPILRRVRTTPTKMQADEGGAKRMSYAERLKAAQAAKAAARVGDQPSGNHSGVMSTPPSAPPAAAEMNPQEGGGGGGLPDVAEPESPFSDVVFEEIRTAIKILAARLQREKPLSRDEFERFEAAVAIIVEDALPMQELPAQPAPVAPAATVAAAPAALPVSNVASPNLRRTGDDIDNEGPAWDNKGYGLPSGTQNTYVLEGMEAMTPEQYQEALRHRVSARARAARESKSYGNIVSNDYLKYLNKNPKSDDEEARQEQEKLKDHENFRNYK